MRLDATRAQFDAVMAAASSEPGLTVIRVFEKKDGDHDLMLLRITQVGSGAPRASRASSVLNRRVSCTTTKIASTRHNGDKREAGHCSLICATTAIQTRRVRLDIATDDGARHPACPPGTEESGPGPVFWPHLCVRTDRVTTPIPEASETGGAIGRTRPVLPELSRWRDL
jgi:hypothetical protein